MRVFLLFCLLLGACVAHAQDRRVDEHSYAEPGKVRIRDLSLDLQVDFSKRELAGEALLTLTWLDPTHRVLNLDSRDLNIERVQGRDGRGRWQRLDFTVAPRDAIFGSRLSIVMPQPLSEVRIRYRTSPQASGLQWLTPAMTAGGRLPFMFSQSQAIHARSWVPLQDTPSVRFTYSARVRTPRDVMALMSADNDPAAPRDGDYSFKMPQAIPSYLLAIAAGDLVFKPTSTRSGVWAEPAVVDKAVAEFIDTEKMIAVAEGLYGDYRWGRYDLLILPPSFPFGGMENPRLSFITPTVIAGDKSLVSLIAHELAHSWSGNLVTNSSWKDMWLNEGFTSYVEGRIIEAVNGPEFVAMENVINQRGLREELETLAPERERLVLPPLVGVDPDEALTDVAYIKGQWFLTFLEQRFGRALFDPFLRSWFERHAFQSVGSEQFIAFLRSELMAKKPGAISETELDTWLNQPGIPPFATPAQSDKFAAVDAQREEWLKRRKAARELSTSAWSTQEWVHFLEGMPNDLNPERLVDLDSAFRFTGTGNGEIAQRWYPLATRAGYFEARPAMSAFLRKIGRRKLIMPTYTALAETAEGLAYAKQVFALARPGYHPITVASVEALLNAAKPAQ